MRAYVCICMRLASISIHMYVYARTCSHAYACIYTHMHVHMHCMPYGCMCMSMDMIMKRVALYRVALLCVACNGQRVLLLNWCRSLKNRDVPPPNSTIARDAKLSMAPSASPEADHSSYAFAPSAAMTPPTMPPLSSRLAPTPPGSLPSIREMAEEDEEE